MSEIDIDSDTVSELLKKNRELAVDAAEALGGFSASFDGGLASGEISFITRLAIEGAQLSADIATALSAVAGAALDGQLTDEQAIKEALDNFSETEFDE